MACYSPMLISKYYTDSGKKDFKFLGKADNEFLKDFYTKDLKYKHWYDNNFVIVPCGNCIGCRLDYASTWADRMLVESFDKDCLFVTLTYNDENIHLSKCGFPTLVKEHLDKFIVSLRNKFRDKKIRYCIGDEYGDNTLRPHYHLILYGLTIDDLQCDFYKLNDLFQPMYTSKVLEDLWSFGFNCVGVGEYNSMAYTAKYILKKQKGQGAAEYDVFDLKPPTFRMSRRPGIGCDWLIDNYQELYENGFIPIQRSIKPSGKILPNRYFNKIVKEIDPSLFFHYQSKVKQKNIDSFYELLNHSSMDFDNILAFYEFEKENFLKKSSINRENFS